MARMITNVSVRPSPTDHVASMLEYFITLPTIPYTELTIQSEHSSIRLHSSIISSASPMISSLLSPLPTNSPHPYLPGVAPTSPNISIPHISSKSSLNLVKELLYTGNCVSTQDELNEVMELLIMLGVKDLDQIIMEGEVGFVTADTLDLVMEDSESIELKESNIEQFENFENVTDQLIEEKREENSEQVAVQEAEGPDSEHTRGRVDEEHNQFPAFLHSKFDILSVKIRKTHNKIYVKRTESKRRKQQPELDSVRRSFFCPHCHKKFIRLKDKEMHALLEHSYEQPFICMECGVRFKVKEGVEQHLKLHGGGGIQIKCEVCDQVCKTISMYFSHYKSHSGLKEFGCSKCGKSFATINLLAKHEEVHRPFKFACYHCNKGFHRRDNMKNHMIKHHENVC